ncbi:MAG: hypothetical protein ACW980_24260 [Promethearchaeota archaeon]
MAFTVAIDPPNTTLESIVIATASTDAVAGATEVNNKNGKSIAITKLILNLLANFPPPNIRLRKNKNNPIKDNTIKTGSKSVTTPTSSQISFITTMLHFISLYYRVVW